MLLSQAFSASGQQLQNTLGTVTISSPTAASLGKFGDIPVSYHTGVPNISIPLYTVKAGQLSLPISLSYHASGLKVMEPAGWVGAGWSLNAGGVITRTVVGQPDECGANSGAQTHGHYSHNGYNSYLYSGSQQDWQGFSAGRKDGEPDMFFFNFAGYSGKFYFRDDHTPIIVPQQDLRITPVYTGGRSFDYFTITTPDGTQYLFGNVPGVTGTAPVETTNCYSAKNGAVGFPPVSSWYLSKIISADNQFSINLSYQAESYGYFTVSMFPVDGAAAGNDALGYDLVKNIIQGVRLSQISFPDGTVTFTPGSARTDLANDVQSLVDGLNTSSTSLGAIQINNSNGFCKKFNFNYDYVTSTTTSLPNNLTWGYTITSDLQRLYLKSIQEVACDGSINVPPYQFTYYDQSHVPRRLSFGLDHWGYSNGQTGNTALIPTIIVNGNSIPGANRDAAWPAMLGGALTRIDYPTGGSSAFDFESNTGIVTTTQIVPKQLAAFAFHVFGQNDISGSTPFQTTGYDVILHVSTNCNYGVHVTITNSSNQAVYTVLLSNTPNSPTDPPVVSDIPITALAGPSTGPYTINAAIDINPINANLIQGGVSLQLKTTEEQTTTSMATLGGIRIKSITDAAGSTDVPKITNFTYSGAILYSAPTYAQRIRNDIIANVGFWEPGTGFGSGILIANGCPSTGDYYKSPGSLRPMATFDGSIIGYLTVTVTQPGNGRTVYDYSTPTGGYGVISNVLSASTVVQLSCNSSIPNYPAPPLPYDPRRGQLESEDYFDENDHLVKDISYFPVYNESPVLSTPAFIVANSLIAGSSQLLGTNYSLNTARRVSMQIQERDYGQSGQTLTKVTTTYFGSPYHNQPTRQVMTTSLGDNLVTQTSYAMDLRVAACDIISDCSPEYNNNCSSCQSAYNTARSGCSGSSACLTNAYLSFLQCNTNARISYVSCRNTNYMGTTNNFDACHLNAENAADGLLKPVLQLHDLFVNAPIEVSEWKNSMLKHSTFTGFEAAASPAGFPYPGKKYLVNLQATTGTFTPAVISGNTIAKDSRYSQEATFSFANGNPIQTMAKDGITYSYIWDYKNTRPIAKVTSAPVSQAAYTSFEADGNGGWTIPSSMRDGVNAITGQQSYNLSNGQCARSGLTSATAYIVSYWSKTGASYSVTGSTAVRQGKTITINGGTWTYFEHSVTGTTSVTISGSGNIDELRLFPAGAQMTSYCYIPLLGMISECDMNNRITYYDYDKLGRMTTVRDQDGNITKTINYHYKGETTTNF